MNYIKRNNTYRLVAKDNPRDRVEVIVGDDKQPDFKPQVKIERWDNECNFSLRLKTSVAQVPREAKGEITTENIRFRPYPEGFDFEVVLPEKPKPNIIEYTLDSKGVQFFYQPELTEEEKEQGGSRPENVIGSYAVYASEQKVNYVGKKEYKVGKVGHLYRQKATDSKGESVWCDMKIEDDTLKVEIPQKFLDFADYPVYVRGG